MSLQKLNLGCGFDKRKGFLNIDAVAAVKPDLVHDLHKPLPFGDNSIDHVLAQDILEHFTKEDVQSVIKEMSRVLRTGGTIEARVPNIDDIIERFAADPETRNEFLYGMTVHTGIFGAHKVGFTPELLVRFFVRHSVYPTHIERIDTNYRFVFEKQAEKAENVHVLFLTDQRNSSLFPRTHSKGHKQAVTTLVLPEWSLSFSAFLRSAFSVPILVINAWRIQQTAKPNLVLADSFWAFIVSGLVGMVCGRPIIWIETGATAKQLTTFFRLPKLLYYLVKSIPKSVIVFDESIKQQLITTAHVNLSQLEVISDKASTRHTLLLNAIKDALHKQHASKLVIQFDL